MGCLERNQSHDQVGTGGLLSSGGFWASPHRDIGDQTQPNGAVTGIPQESAYLLLAVCIEKSERGAGGWACCIFTSLF